MNHTDTHNLISLEQAASVLAVDADADDQTIRTAYIEQIKAHPPEVDPDEFEQIRDAYELLCDPRQRALHLLLVDPRMPLVSLLDHHQHRFVGSQPWWEALSERSRL